MYKVSDSHLKMPESVFGVIHKFGKILSETERLRIISAKSLCEVRVRLRS